jgi:hypothetical protein
MNTPGLLVGEKIHALEEQLTNPEEGFPGSASVSEDLLLEALPALGDSISTELDHVEGVEDFHGVGQLLDGGGFEPGEPVHGDDLDPIPEVLSLGLQPAREDLFGAAFDHVQ